MVSNAIKFTEQGSIRIITKVSAEDETSYTLLAEVVDTGIGVPLHAIGPLFAPFAQFDSTRMRSIILTSITISQIGFVCAGIIFTAENMNSFLEAVSKTSSPLASKSLIGFQRILLIPLAFVRNISKLSGAILLADVCILLGLGYIYYFDISTMAMQNVNKTVQLLIHGISP